MNALKKAKKGKAKLWYDSGLYNSRVEFVGSPVGVYYLDDASLLNTTWPTEKKADKAEAKANKLAWTAFATWSGTISATPPPPPPPAPAGVLLRQGLWAGLLASLCVWLQINRNLTLPLAFVLGASLFALEWLLRLLERSSRRSIR